MRRTFINTLIELAEKDKGIFLLTGDLGFSVLERFRDKFPDRFFDVGVAEQNMIGVAAGLALSGKIVFVYSIVPFVTMRCFEQIRNDLCFQNLNVRLVGTGGGFSYGSAGSTHYALEDVAIMRSLVNMTVICPADPIETELVVKSSLSHQGPIYIRLGKRNEPVIHSKLNFQIGRGIIVEHGGDVTIIASGSMLLIAKQISESLKNNNLSVRIISMPTVKPLDKRIILKSARETKAIFTLEEHSIIGGLGSAVSEVLAESKHKVMFKRFALPDRYNEFVGSQKYLLERSGLSVQQITKTILKCRQEWHNGF